MFITQEIRPGITLHIEPNVTLNTEEFIRKKPSNSLGLDGFDVAGLPNMFVSPEGIHFIYDHHGHARLQMLSTAKQIYEGIRYYRLLDALKKNGQLVIHIFLNRLDQDSALAAFLLAEHELVTETKDRKMMARLKFIVDAVNILDVSAGMCAGDLTERELEKVTYLFLPCFELASNRQLGPGSAAKQHMAFELIRQNLLSFIKCGKVGRVPLNYDFQVVEQHEHWTMVREIGHNCRLNYAKAGITAFVAFSERTIGDGYNFALGRLSEPAAPFFHLPFLYQFINAHYGTPETDADRCNGGSTVGGTDRKRGCPDMPNEFGKVVDQGIEMYKALLGIETQPAEQRLIA